MTPPDSRLLAALSATERLQQELAQDLHDTLCQSLTGLTLMVRVLARRASVGAALEAADLLELSETVEVASREARSLLGKLRPVRPEAQGLMDALAELASDANAKMTCHFQCNDPVLISEYDTSVALFRIAEEAVKNARQHSRGSLVTTRLSRQGGGALLEIQDDGRGFDASSAGRGILLMQARAAAIGATLNIDSSEKGGTTVKVAWRYR